MCFPEPRPITNNLFDRRAPLSPDGMGDSLEFDILSTLDALVASGIIQSGPYEAIELEDEGYPVSNLC
jgi:hypothetical protein